jgi:hypothetical protein
MSYNIEDQEDFLKNESPYNMSEDKWKAMQQRVKQNVLAATSNENQPKIKKFSYWKITTIAAAVISMVLATTLYFNTSTRKQEMKNTSNLAVNQTITTPDPEMQLDNAISNLNEEELNLSHQLSENEIPDQNEYFDN